MRMNRIKPENEESWHHCYNRVSGTALDRPLGPAEKEKFIRILLWVSRLLCVQPVAFQVMSTHYHILLRTPAQTPTEEETCRRYTQYYGGKRWIEPGTEACRLWQERLRDVSWFQRLVQQRFTTGYNRIDLLIDRCRFSQIRGGGSEFRRPAADSGMRPSSLRACDPARSVAGCASRLRQRAHVSTTREFSARQGKAPGGADVRPRG